MLANDPDADRLPSPIPGPGGWRRLHGDEIGALLADFRLEHCEDPRRALLVTTVASSTLLGRMAEAAGARYAETLTGFKWMMRAVAAAPEQRLLLAYEEALGYAVSDVVRDKDGISAALVMAQLAATEKRAGRTLTDRLEAIAARYGAHATDQVTLELEGADGQERMRADHGATARRAARDAARAAAGRARRPGRGDRVAAARRRADPARARTCGSWCARAAPSRSSSATWRSSPATAPRPRSSSRGCVPSSQRSSAHERCDRGSSRVSV